MMQNPFRNYPIDLRTTQLLYSIIDNYPTNFYPTNAHNTNSNSLENVYKYFNGYLNLQSSNGNQQMITNNSEPINLNKSANMPIDLSVFSSHSSYTTSSSMMTNCQIPQNENCSLDKSEPKHEKIQQNYMNKIMQFLYNNPNNSYSNFTPILLTLINNFLMEQSTKTNQNTVQNINSDDKNLNLGQTINKINSNLNQEKKNNFTILKLLDVKNEKKHLSTYKTDRSQIKTKVKSKQLKCNLCNYITNKQINLYRHNNQVHNNSLCNINNNDHNRNNKKEKNVSNMKRKFKRQSTIVLNQSNNEIKNNYSANSLSTTQFSSQINPPKSFLNNNNNKKTDTITLTTTCNTINDDSYTHPYYCNLCTKIYYSMSALKMHVRTHTLPCKCDLCGKAFSRMWLLNGHLRTHTGEKPFACILCNRAFADRSNLRAHMQTHSDIKRYQCTQCDRTFSRMGLLTKHQTNSCLQKENKLSNKSRNLIKQE